MGQGEAVDPLRSGGEGDPVTGLAGPDGQPDGQMGLARAWWAEEHHVLAGLDEVQGTQVGHHLPAQAALVVEVEVLQGLARREAGSSDAQLPAVGLACRHLPLQAGSQELLVAPPLGSCPLTQALDGPSQVRGLESPAKIHQVGGGSGRGSHHATSVMRS